MMKKLMVLALILGVFTGISAMKEPSIIAKEYIAGKMIADDNEQLKQAILEDNTEKVYDLFRKPTVDICQAIQVAYDAKQLNILKLLADWCCCKSKIMHVSEPPSGAAALVVSNLASSAKQHSGFLPPSGASVYTLNSEGSLQAKPGFDNKTGPLIVALDSANIEQITKLINRGGGFSANSVLVISNPRGNTVQTVAQYALRLRNIELIDALLKAGININNGSGSGVGTLLHAAVANLDPEMVKFLIGKGANVNTVDASGTTPLHIIASLAGSPAAAGIAQELINAGAKTTIKNNEGKLPLALIQENENTRAVAEAIGKADRERLLTQEEIAELPDIPEGAIHIEPQRSQRKPGQLYVPRAIPISY